MILWGKLEYNFIGDYTSETEGVSEKEQPASSHLKITKQVMSSSIGFKLNGEDKL